MDSFDMSVIDLADSSLQGELPATSELSVIDLSETLADSSLNELAGVTNEEEQEVLNEEDGEAAVLTEDEDEVTTEDEAGPDLEDVSSDDEDEMPELEYVDMTTREEEAAAAAEAEASRRRRRLLELLLELRGAPEEEAAAAEAEESGFLAAVLLLLRGAAGGLETPPRRLETPARGLGAEQGGEMVLETTIDLTDSPITNQGTSPLPSDPLASLTCPVCLDTLASITRRGGRVVSTRCGHVFCGSCLPRCIQATGQCPTCRTRLTLFGGFHPLYLN